MTLLLESPPRARVGVRRNDPQRTRPPLGWLLLALVAAGLIFCHGCHRGDHDDELAVVLFDRR